MFYVFGIEILKETTGTDEKMGVQRVKQLTQGKIASWQQSWDQIPSPLGLPTQVNSHWANNKKKPCIFLN